MLKLRLYFYSVLSMSFLILVMTMMLSERSTVTNDVHPLGGVEEYLDNITSEKYDQTNMKYILLWNGKTNWPFWLMLPGRESFIENHCPVNNCYVTTSRSFRGAAYTAFDAIIFDGREVGKMNIEDLPQTRLPSQKYIFFALESASNYPVDSKFDNFFNWTWTYKLHSDSYFGYIWVHDLKGEVIGPKIHMHWLREMKPIGEDIKAKLKSKSKAAAWFVSNCRSNNGREQFVKEVQEHLKPYGLTVDVYGSCGPHECPRNSMNACLEKLEKDYYFYFSFENSFSEDYVTEKLFHALQHNTVPVVFGGANYTRFMPDGIYLDARKLGPERLARLMHKLIQEPEKYYSFFRYKEHYAWYRPSAAVGSERLAVDSTELCTICAMLNNKTLVEQTTTYPDFRGWWNK